MDWKTTNRCSIFLMTNGLIWNKMIKKVEGKPGEEEYWNGRY